MIPSDEGLLLQLAAFAGDEPESSFLEIRCLHKDGKPGPREFLPVRELKAIIGRITSLTRVNVYIGAIPRIRENGTAEAVERQWTLWADCDSDDAVEKLRGFRPLPGIVVKTSPGRLQALWPLKRSIEPEWGRKANRRLAYHLGADMAATDPARILRAVGSRNHKHSPPAKVLCVRAELEVFQAREVVGTLLDPPVPVRLPYTGPTTCPEAVDGLVRVVREAAEGERNHVLFWAACRDLERGHGAHGALYRAGIDVGLPHFEVERTLQSASQHVEK